MSCSNDCPFMKTGGLPLATHNYQGERGEGIGFPFLLPFETICIHALLHADLLPLTV